MAQNITIAGASYEGVPAVDLPKTGGGTARFYDASGNIALTPGLTEQSVDVKSCATASVAAITKELLAGLDSDFVAENIKKDVDLFGLLGTMEAGGGAAGIATGVYIPTATGYDNTITHGLGVIPKVFAICAGGYIASGSYVLDSAHGFSDRGLLFRMSRISAGNSPTGYIYQNAKITQQGFVKNTALAKANETTISVGGNYQLFAGIEYYWFALA